jgi:ornithine cyclodeaminase
VLHISLRDLSPEAILAADNVVDDLDHVVREGTSLHLAEQRVGHRGFVRATLAEVLTGAKTPRRSIAEPLVFSPFGLGILDLAVGQFAIERAHQAGLGRIIEGFTAPPWNEWT